MFPGIDGFHWTFGHILFLSLFFIVVATIFTTVISAVWQTRRDFCNHHALEFCWKSDFEELPASDRRCRHELAGRVNSRTCNNSFDCRHCSEYAHFAALPATGTTHSSGLYYPDDRYYHRGHTWVKLADYDTVLVGLDDFSSRMVGVPESIAMPQIGADVELNQVAWRMKKNGREILVRAPIEGKVVSLGGPKEGWYLQIRPRFDLNSPATLRHLLRGPEVNGWLNREMERLQLQLRAQNTPPALADGGTILPDLMDAIPEADWDTVLADTFLEV